ncbi:hypothetical protein MGMO_18c00230 [Methyloglobulus morosus KoM1]|uniref:Nitroreductase n=1 Tax=Methyloglobulus morosus KoM1 TaxID=1116472 RepID=V5BJN1_9GAMM|nr:ArsC/Spx/MgsR family protein [Methyloglobulus morosus]ESS73515.1 hypothetical protein MGMO_18c00230 [Methyloglobulus morosus KoM1]
MAIVIFYEKPGCANNSRQKQLLEKAGHQVVPMNLLTNGFTADELRPFFGDKPVTEWFNRAAPQIKSEEITPENLTETEALNLMLTDPLLIRRPLLQVGEQRDSGFDQDRIDSWIGLSPEQVEALAEQDLERCRRNAKPTLSGAIEMTSASNYDHVLAYHNRTKHRLERYATGPETLDWTSQPNPFREFSGAPRITLPFADTELATPFANLYQPSAVAPQPLDLQGIGWLLELALGISAWKEYGPDRWALRCNPSSGNLHPTEGYIVCEGVPDLSDGVYHYISRDHVLERRFNAYRSDDTAITLRLFVGLSSIHWREAWKYGERAFRYCQHDVGHAIGTLRYAAAALGWSVRIVENLGSDRLAGLLGLNRNQDFTGAETEEPELLLAITANTGEADSDKLPDWDLARGEWYGKANTLDPHPMYHWPVIDEVAAATRKPVTDSPIFQPTTEYPPLPSINQTPAAALIRQRRSAQHFDGKPSITAAVFYHILDCLLPRPAPPWDVWQYPPRLHPVLFVHRVDGLTPGLYILPRSHIAESSLRAALSSEFAWVKAQECPDHLPLFQLVAADCGQASQTISCHQAIAKQGCFSLGMLAEFEPTIQQASWLYRELYWEAGLLGQVLYLEAEAAGVRGTGIGCYFDDSMHELLGLSGQSFQSLYHFTIGYSLNDARILTLPPYPKEMR